MPDAPNEVLLSPLDDGALWRLSLNAPPGNVLDQRMVDSLISTFEAAAREPGLKALVLASEGEHWCYGASVREHLPAEVGPMLERMDRLLRAIADARVFVLAAVRGLCLGGGLELAACAHRIVSARDAQFGCPEIRLGVFAPFAAAILPGRLGDARTNDLLASGRTVPALEALKLGLVDDVVENPEAAAKAWARQNLLPHSASSLRLQNAAARAAFDDRYDRLVPRLLSVYRKELMATRDAVEGLEAFLQKRPPQWKDA